MRKIVVALSKGGVGKTATACHLAHGLARAGHKVLLVDTDTQAQCSYFLGARPEVGLAEVLAGEAKPREAMAEVRKGLWLLAGGRGLAGSRRVIARMDAGGEKALVEALAPLEGKLDYVLLDTSPGWDGLTVASLFYAREVLVPVSMDVATLLGLLDFQEGLKAVQKYHAGLELKYILPTFFDRRVKKSEEVLEQLKGHYPRQLCQPIRYSVRLSECVGLGKTVYEYAPKSSGPEDYQKLMRRVVRDGRQG
jgi:chromosome partitioning protein